jgi:spore germination protein KB
MNEKEISDKEGLSILVLFMIGTASVIVPGIAVAKRDIWLTVIIAVIAALFVALMCARMHYILPKKDLFEMLEFCYGKFFGRLISLVYWWFFFHAGLLVSMDITEFIKIVSLDSTPYIALQGSLVFLGIYVVREGLIVLGRWSKLFLKFIIFLIFTSTILLVSEMNIDNITPALYYGFKPVIGGAFVLFSFPLAQLAPFMAIFGNLKTKQSSYNIYIKGILVSGFVLFIVATANILILGPDIASTLFFPSHDTLKRLHLGTSIQRLEIIADGVFVLGGFVMFSTYLTACSKALSRTFGFADHKFIVLPIGLLILNFSRILNEGFIDHLMFVKTWPIYSFPFLVIFPIIIWVTLEIKIKCSKNL